MIGNALSKLAGTGAQGPAELMQLLAVQNAQRQAQQARGMQMVTNPLAGMMQGVGQGLQQPGALSSMGMGQLSNAQGMEKEALAGYSQKAKAPRKPAVNSGQGNTAIGLAAFLMALGVNPREILGAGQTYFGGLANKAQQDREQEMQAAELEYKAKMQDAGAIRERAGLLRDESRFRAGEAKDNTRYNDAKQSQAQQMAMRKDDLLFDRNRQRQADATNERRYQEGRGDMLRGEQRQDSRYYSERLMSEDTPYWAIPSLVEGYRKSGGDIDPKMTQEITKAARTRYQQGQEAARLKLDSMLQDKTLRGQQIKENNERLKFLGSELKDAATLRGLGIDRSVFEYHQAIRGYADALGSGNAVGAAKAQEQAFDRSAKIISTLTDRYDMMRKQLADITDQSTPEAKALQESMKSIEGRIKTYEQQQDAFMGVGTGKQGAVQMAPFGIVPEISDNGRSIRVGNAQVKLGVPYKWGGTDPSKGIDCSALTQCIYADNGMKIPRTAIQQWRDPKLAKVKTPAPGDLVFFDTGVNRDRERYAKDAGGYVTHVGIYVGDGKVLQAGSKGGTSVVPLSMFKNILGYKRPVA